MDNVKTLFFMVFAILITLSMSFAGVAQQTNDVPANSSNKQASFGTYSSTNPIWAGYAVSKSNNYFRVVSGQFVVPTLNCGSTPNAQAAIWVGIDGYNAQMVEQDGIAAKCSGGSPQYQAWWEFFGCQLVSSSCPNNGYPIYISTSTITINAGDTMIAQVYFNANGQNQFEYYIMDLTTFQQSITYSKKYNANLASTEWIIESPSSTYLTNYGVTYFTNGYASSTLSHQSYVYIQNWGSSLHKLNEDTSSGTRMQTTSSLSGNYGDFHITWNNAGPQQNTIYY